MNDAAVVGVVVVVAIVLGVVLSRFVGLGYVPNLLIGGLVGATVYGAASLLRRWRSTR